MEKSDQLQRSSHIATVAVCGSVVAGLFLFTGMGGTPYQDDTTADARVMSTSRAADVDLSEAMEQRTELLKRAVSVKLTAGSGKTLASWSVALEKNPSWVVFEVDLSGTARAAVNTERVRQHLISYPVADLRQPKSCRILSEWTDDQQVLRAQTDCIAESGYVYDVADLALAAKQALEEGRSEAEYRLTPVIATIAGSGEPDSVVTETLTLLATGESNFKGSGEGRKSNVRKALNERVNNIIVPQGAVFSFNSTLGTVALSKGWKMALTIFEGVNLRPAPGGGICQASTTTYRAAIAAGLPILEQKNHSIYVSFYESGRVGQDATVFPGLQDMTFLNDTPGPLLIQSYSRGDDAFVSIFGIDDGREVVISGPYFKDNAPQDLTDTKKLRGNDIAWKREVTLPGSEPTNDIYVARYNAIPRSLPKRALPAVTQVRGTPDIAEVATVADAHAAAR